MALRRRMLLSVLSLAMLLGGLMPPELLAMEWQQPCGATETACCCGHDASGAAPAGTALSKPACRCAVERAPAPPAQGSKSSPAALLLIELAAPAPLGLVPPSCDDVVGPAWPRDAAPACSARELRERHCVFRI